MFETTSLALRAAIASLLGSCFAVALLAFSHGGAHAQTPNAELGASAGLADRGNAINAFGVERKAGPWELTAAATADQTWQPTLVGPGQFDQAGAPTARQRASEPAFGIPESIDRGAKLGLGLMWPWSRQRALRLEFENRSGNVSDRVRVGVQMRF